jgi:hypothetical protein
MMTDPTTSQEQEAQYDFVPSNFLLIAWGLSYAFSVRVSRAALAIAMTMITYTVLGYIMFHVLGGQAPTVAP